VVPRLRNLTCAVGFGARGQIETMGESDFLPALDDKRGLVVDAILFTNLL
jgi:hypothetical protein